MPNHVLKRLDTNQVPDMCYNDLNITKYYYWVKDLKIDVSRSTPIVASFNIFAVSDVGLNAGWSNMNSYSIPIHFISLDIENSSDLNFMIRSQPDPKTNLEHPGYFYSCKIGILLPTQFKIERVKFLYDSEKKIIYNANEGIIGQTRLSNTRDDLPERPFLRISVKSEKSHNYYHFISRKKQEESKSSYRRKKNYLTPNKLNGREVRVDYEDDPELTDEEFSSLTLTNKFIYKLLHDRNDELCDDPVYAKYEKAWESYARKNSLSKYDESLYFEFTSYNKGENLPSFGKMTSNYQKIKNMFEFAHFDRELKVTCKYFTNFPYRKWIRLPNDFTHDEYLDKLNQESHSQEIFKGIKLREVFKANLIPSEGFFEVPEPNWMNNQMYNVYEVGIYTDEGILTRYSLRTPEDKKFLANNFDRITWFPFRILGPDSQVVNILKNQLDPFSKMALNISVDKYGMVLYSKDEVAEDEYEKKMLWQKFKDILFDSNANSMVFMGKVQGYISIEKMQKILLISSRRNYNYKGYIMLSNQLNDLMDRGFGREEYKQLLKRLFKTESKRKKKADLFNEQKLQMLF